MALWTTAAMAEPVDRIAYVSWDDEVYTIRPDGTEPQNRTAVEPARQAARPRRPARAIAVTVGELPGPWPAQAEEPEPRLFSWPTWSPDGRRILCHGVRLAEDGPVFGVYSVAASGLPLIATLFESSREQPIYAAWAPDQRRVAVLLDRAGELGLGVLDATRRQPPVSLVRGAPLYFAWAPNGGALLVHVDGNARISPGARVALWSASGEETQLLSSSPAEFRAASWSPGGEWIAFAGFVEHESHVLLAAARGAKTRRLESAGDNAVFSWSPRADLLAVSAATGSADLLFDGITVHNLADGSQTALTTEPVGAFFWSPAGDRILYASPDRRARVWAWHAIDPDGHRHRKLAEFLPSPLLLQVFAHFDQYALSHRLWSPDGRRFVYAGFPIDETSPRQPVAPRIFVADVEGDRPPRAIAEGAIAFWSWE